MRKQSETKQSEIKLLLTKRDERDFKNFFK